MLAQRLVAHEQAQVTPVGDVPLDQIDRGRGVVGDREHLIGRSDVIGGAGQQVQRHVDPCEVNALPADPELAADELVVTKQVSDDPQACLLYTSPSPRD